MDVGTRWEHYSELRELFSIGIEILKNVRIKSSTDQLKRAQLEGAVELIDARINLLSDFHFKTTYGSPLRGVVDGEVDNLFRAMKRGREDAAKETKPITPPDPSNEDGDGPETYTTK
jgi:hypothetical protein